MVVIISNGEQTNVNIYTLTAGCEEIFDRRTNLRNLNFRLEFGCKNLICGLIIICDWQNLEKLEISWFHFSEQSFWYAYHCAKFYPFITFITFIKLVQILKHLPLQIMI